MDEEIIEIVLRKVRRKGNFNWKLIKREEKSSGGCPHCGTSVVNTYENPDSGLPMKAFECGYTRGHGKDHDCTVGKWVAPKLVA